MIEDKEECMECMKERMECMKEHMEAIPKLQFVLEPIPQFHGLHDLESIWWVAMWTLLKYTTEASLEEKGEESVWSEIWQLQDFANRMFPCKLDDQRNNFFKYHQFMEKLRFRLRLTLGQRGMMLTSLAFLRKHLIQWLIR